MTQESNDGLREEIHRLRQEVQDLRTRERALTERVRSLETQNTAQLQANQEIIRLERLRALEEMAQGVAHNFNNVLVGVLGYAQIIELQSKDEKAVANAKKIVENALRAKELVQRLNLSVREAGDLPLHRITTLDTIVREAIKATQSQWSEEARSRGVTITVVEDLVDVPPVKGNPVELHHVLVHLIANAIDATLQSGEIAISMRTKGDQVLIQVEDHGVGMDEQTRMRIFEPFFTTKQDVGSGLGLSMAYRTVTAWGGRLEVESIPDQGSIFSVWLPVWSEDAPEAKVQGVADTGRILIVDDEESVHEVLKEALHEHTLTLYDNGEEALSEYRPGVYDVGLIDLRLPGMSGDELAQQIRALDPDFLMVMLTGWDILEDDPRHQLFDFHVPKPFRLNELKDTVLQAIELHAQRSGS